MVGLAVVGISEAGVGIAGTPPTWVKPAKVSVQSLFGSCCLRYAAKASNWIITGTCGGSAGWGCWGFCDGPPSVVGSSVWVFLLVIFFFLMGESVVYGGCRAVVFGEEIAGKVLKDEGE